MSVWILVANASKATLYQSPNAALWRDNIALEAVDNFSHDDSRKRGGEIKSDRLGNYSYGYSGQSGSYASATDPKEHEAENFAKELVSTLEQGRVNNAYTQLVIAAGPHFHGLINKQLNGKLSKMVRQHIEKDYTQDNEEQLLKHLRPYFQ